MNKMEYMPVDCLQVPKVLFQMEKYKNLSNTAKILYSLFLDRLKFAVQNGWVDGKGDLYVIYPKSEMKKDLNTTRYGVDQAVQELVEIGNLVRIIPNNGKANHFYINDIYENEMEEESMMTLDRIMANMPMEEREIIMDKMVAASRDILETIADMGYLDEYETPLTPMEERGYYDEEGNLDIDAIEAEQWLKTLQVEALLKELGYDSMELHRIFRKLEHRIGGHGNGEMPFPHELGLLLGYPAEDVRGFMGIGYKKCLYTGYWKVYEKAEEKIALFSEYDRAMDLALSMAYERQNILKLKEVFEVDSQEKKLAV